jgi:hypothetical protein
MKIHLVPRTQTTMCGRRINPTFKIVATRAEFNKLSANDRCGMCDAIVNGKGIKQ